MATPTRVKPVVTLPVRVRARATYVALAVVSILVATTAIEGSWLNRQGDGIGLHAAPLFAAASSRFSAIVLIPLALAAVVVWRGPTIAERLPWRRLLVLGSLGAVVWGVGLALVDHGLTDGLIRGVSSPQDFLADVGRVAAPVEFLDTFTERIGSYVVHVRGHPPGLPVALWWIGRVVGGPAPMVVLALGGVAAAVAGALVALREVAGEQTARRAAPFLVLSPAAIWFVTSADAIYAGVAALGIAAIVVATRRRSDPLAVAGGVVFGAGLFLSYGLVPLIAVPLVVAISRRRLRPLVVAGAAMAAVGIAFAAFGFWWVEGMQATRAEYASSIAAMRPYGYFVFANLAAFAVTLGPAPVAGLAVLRDRRVWLLAGAALVAILAADLSGLSKGEVERIWLPFWPWIAIAAAALTTRVRWWLAAQAAVAIGIQTLLGTPW